MARAAIEFGNMGRRERTHTQHLKQTKLMCSRTVFTLDLHN